MSASATVELRSVCHGNWQVAGLSCSLSDLLFDTQYAAQLFDWQNAVFLLFMPLLLGIATLSFRLTYGASGGVKLDQVFKKAGDMHEAFADWGTQRSLAVEGSSFGHDDAGTADDIEMSEPPSAQPVVRDDARIGASGGPVAREMKDLASDEMDDKNGSSETRIGQVQLHTSSHPTDVDPRNLSVMISLSAFIISIGMVCWASISEFVDTYDLNQFKSSGIFAQGFATQTLDKGLQQRGINIGWGACWLCIGTLLMLAAQQIIRRVVIGPNFNVVEAVLEKGNVAAAICEAGMQVSMGMVTSAAISGPPEHFGFDVAACLLYYVLALICLVLWSKAFDLYTTEWSTWKEIERGNIAAAISQFSQMVATALLLSNAISKTFELATFFAWFATGSAVRMLFRTVMDYCLIAPRCINPRYTREDLRIDKLILKGNWGASLVVGALQIVITHIINSFLPDSCRPFAYSDGRLVSQMTLAEKLAGTDYLFVIWKWDRLVALAITFVTFCMARIPYDLRLSLASRMVAKRDQLGPPIDPDLNYYLVEGRLHAVTISFGAYLVAVGNMLVGIFKDANYVTSFVDSDDPEAWGFLLLQIAVGYVMIIAALLISDIFILHKFDNVALMAQEDNRSVALIEAGSLVGSSFIVGAVINGWDYSDPPYASACIFFLMAQLLFFLFQLVFEAVTAYDDEKEVRMGNAAAGVNNGMNLAAIGMLLGRASYLSHSLVMLMCWALVTFPLVFITRVLTDKIVLPNIHLEATIECLDRLRPDVLAPRRPCKQGNWGTALVAGTVTISLAQLLNTFLRDCPFDLGIPFVPEAA